MERLRIAAENIWVRVAMVAVVVAVGVWIALPNDLKSQTKLYLVTPLGIGLAFGVAAGWIKLSWRWFFLSSSCVAIPLFALGISSHPIWTSLAIDRLNQKQSAEIERVWATGNIPRAAELTKVRDDVALLRQHDQAAALQALEHSVEEWERMNAWDNTAAGRKWSAEQRAIATPRR